MADTPKKTREELLAARAAREEADAKALEAHKDLVLELEDQLTAQFGKRGVGWEMVNADEVSDDKLVPDWGPVAVRRAEAVTYKKFTSTETTLESKQALVASCVVHPTREQWVALSVGLEGLLDRAVLAIMDLAGVTKVVLARKR